MATVAGRKANFLRLVEVPQEPNPLGKATFVRYGWQNTLFADEHTSLLVVVEFDRLPASDFLSLIASGNPKVVFDLRQVPRFDISHLNRRLVLDIFSEKRIEYVDLSGRMSEGRGRLTAGEVATVAFTSRNSVGPIVLIVDKPQADEEYVGAFVEAMPSAPAGVWDVLKLPLGGLGNSSAASKRNLVFLSHANPEDNGIAAWLSGKLAIAGYQVWSDITKLVGGELFWDDIEEAIRHHTTKFIAILSRVSQTKSGVLDEIDLAIRVERYEGLDKLVVPIKVDSLPFTEIRANLSRKNIIDFSESWANGLSALLDVFDRDGVPRIVTKGAVALSETLQGGLRARLSVEYTPEMVVSNWLPIIELPARIDMVDITAPVEAVRSLCASFLWPAFPYLRLIGLFGDDARGRDFEANGYAAHTEYQIPLTEFLDGSPTVLPGLARQEARRHVVSLVRQAWNSLMAQRGLRSLEMASGALAWFLPKDGVEGDWLTFVDDKGIQRRKKLVGWSDRRQVFWHAGFDARLVLSGDGHVVIRQHVIFTEDGSTPMGDSVRMHALRRSFCKSWWNDRWRDLMLAFITFISKDMLVRLPVGPSEAVVLGQPLRALSPVTAGAVEYLVEEEAELVDILDGPEYDFEEIIFEEQELENNETTRE